MLPARFVLFENILKTINNLFEDILEKKWFPYIFIASGILLRLIWVEDIQWKFDEFWIFNKSQEIVQTGIWPKLGMKSGAGIQNPGLSVWIFGLFGFLTDNPLGMTRIVMLLNVLSIFGFLIIAYKEIDKEERKLWVWGIALACVSPLPILWSRSIWAQDLLPFFSVY